MLHISEGATKKKEVGQKGIQIETPHQTPHTAVFSPSGRSFM